MPRRIATHRDQAEMLSPWNIEDKSVSRRQRMARQMTAVYSHTPSSTPFIARGITVDHPEDDHELFRAIRERRATPEQLYKLVTQGGSGDAGVYWGTYGGEHREYDPENSAYGDLEDFQGHTEAGVNDDLSVDEYEDSGQYDPSEPIFAQVPVVMIGQRPQRGGHLWDNEIDNPDNGLMGNSYLNEGEKVPLHEIHYHTGNEWVKVKMPKGIAVTASRRQGMPYRGKQPLRFEPYNPGDTKTMITTNRPYMQRQWPEGAYHPGVFAYVEGNDQPVGQIEWFGDDDSDEMTVPRGYAIGKPGEVSYIGVHPDYRELGIGTELYNHVKKNLRPDLHHSPTQTPMGKEWAAWADQHAAARLAALHEEPWEPTPDGGWSHPSGFVIKPSDEKKGHFQLYSPTVTFGSHGGGLAKVKQPAPNPQSLMDFAMYTQGGPPPHHRHEMPPHHPRHEKSLSQRLHDMWGNQGFADWWQNPLGAPTDEGVSSSNMTTVDTLPWIEERDRRQLEEEGQGFYALHPNTPHSYYPELDDDEPIPGHGRHEVVKASLFRHADNINDQLSGELNKPYQPGEESSSTAGNFGGFSRIPSFDAPLEWAGSPAGGGGGGGGGTPSGSPVPGGGVPLVQNPDGTWTSSDPAWAHLINRESGGRNIIQSPSTHDVNSGGNEAFGLFQITPATWASHGGQGSVYDSTPQQQAQVAAEILRSNPSGSDWGAGLPGRENASALSKALGTMPQPNTQGPAASATPGPAAPAMPKPNTQGPAAPKTGRRIITAKEQVEMLEPWTIQKAAWGNNSPHPKPPEKKEPQRSVRRDDIRIMKDEESGLGYDAIVKPNGRGDGYDVLKPLGALKNSSRAEVLNAEEEGLDFGGKRWGAGCLEHGTVIGARSKADAAATDTAEFCDECRKHKYAAFDYDDDEAAGDNHDLSLMDFYQWCVNNHHPADEESLDEFAQVTDISLEDYRNIAEFLDESWHVRESTAPLSGDTDSSLFVGPRRPLTKPVVPKKKREPKPQQQALIPQNQVQKVPRAKEPKDFSPSEMYQGQPFQAPEKSVQPSLPSGSDFNWSQSLPLAQMQQSLIAKYNAASDDTKRWGSEWYDDASEYIANLAQKTGRDPKQVAAIMAAFSPQTDWDKNMQFATHFLLNYDPNNPNALDTTMPVMSDNLERAKRIHAAQDEAGYLEALQNGNEAPKMTNFYKNMTGNKNAVTIDSWMARALLGQGLDVADKDPAVSALGWTGSYDRMADAVRGAAQQLSQQLGREISPRELQAIIWSHVVPTADYSDYTPETYRKKKLQREKQWREHPNAKPLPDYTHGPAWNSTDLGYDPTLGYGGEQLLPTPALRGTPGYRAQQQQDLPAHHASWEY